MKAILLNVRCNNEGIPIIKLKGKWLEEQGFKKDNRIAVCADEFGKLVIINMDIETHKILEETFQKQIFMMEYE